jgi:desampylase
MTLILPEELRARIEEHARQAFPRECCGLIEGVYENGAARAIALYPARNIATQEDRFEIDPEDHFAALRQARENGRCVIGCYHSHPNGQAVPSSCDLAGAGEENFLWLIASLSGANGPVALADFIYRAGAFLPVAATGAIGADFVTSSEKLRS